MSLNRVVFLVAIFGVAWIGYTLFFQDKEQEDTSVRHESASSVTSPHKGDTDSFAFQLQQYNNFLISQHLNLSPYSAQLKIAINRCDWSSPQSIANLKNIVNATRLDLQKSVAQLQQVHIKHSSINRIHQNLIDRSQDLVSVMKRIGTTLGSSNDRSYTVVLDEWNRKASAFKKFVSEYESLCRTYQISNPALANKR